MREELEKENNCDKKNSCACNNKENDLSDYD